MVTDPRLRQLVEEAVAKRQRQTRHPLGPAEKAHITEAIVKVEALKARLVDAVAISVGQVRSGRGTVANMIRACRSNFDRYESTVQSIWDREDVSVYKRLQKDADDWSPEDSVKMAGEAENEAPSSPDVEGGGGW